MVHFRLGGNAGKRKAASNALGKKHDVRHHPLEVLMRPPLACSANTRLHLPHTKCASADTLSSSAACNTADAYCISLEMHVLLWRTKGLQYTLVMHVQQSVVCHGTQHSLLSAATIYLPNYSYRKMISNDILAVHAVTGQADSCHSVCKG